jgi:hypothetical protein
MRLAEHGDRVGSLVLHAPVWCAGPCEFDAVRVASLTAVHVKSGEMAAAGGTRPLQPARGSSPPKDKLDKLMPPTWFEAWSAAALENDPVGASQNLPVVRVPPGVRQDSADYWDAGYSYYDPKLPRTSASIAGTLLAGAGKCSGVLRAALIQGCPKPAYVLDEERYPLRP